LYSFEILFRHKKLFLGICEQNDSFMGTKSTDAKNESQKHMFEVLGIPCVELALNGLNSTVSPPTEQKKHM
jgi:hypothetical protein